MVLCYLKAMSSIIVRHGPPPPTVQWPSSWISMYLAEIFHEFKQRYASLGRLPDSTDPSAMLVSSTHLKTRKTEWDAYRRLSLCNAEEKMSLDTAACRVQVHQADPVVF